MLIFISAMALICAGICIYKDRFIDTALLFAVAVAADVANRILS